VISMAEGARCVVGQHRRPFWVRLFYVPAASMVEGTWLFLSCFDGVFRRAHWSCSVLLGGCWCRLCVIMFLSLSGVLVSVELYQILFYLNTKRAMHDLEK
jgi:hypothetical protein